MIEPVTYLLWQAAGKPSGDGDIDGICRVCGLLGTGLLFDDWVRPTFTDWDKLQPGDILCQPCQFAFEERSELLAVRVGKDKPQRMRNYSHFVVGGEWVPLSKGDKARMAHILLEKSPEVAIVAVSGQKHIVFRAQPGWWQVEEQSVLPFPGQLSHTLREIESLYAIFSKAEIKTSDYHHDRIIQFGFERWFNSEARLRPLRGAPVFDLALFLAQRKERGTNERICGTGTGVVTEDRDQVAGPNDDGRGESGSIAAAIRPQGVQQLRMGI